MPKISVVVPVYNVEKYLNACLDSILAQTFTDFELILVDDGSPDTSGKICDEYAEKDSRIRVFHQENQGQAAARNFGVTQAKAEWIHFVDSDDIIHPQMLEILYDAVRKDNCKISMCTFLDGETVPASFYERITDYDVSEVTVTDEYLFGLLRTDNLRYHSVCAKIIKKDILLKFPFKAGRTREDSAVVCQWLYEAGKIVNTDCTMYFYIVNPQGTVHSAFDKKNLDILWAWNQQIKFFSDIGFKQSLSFCRAGYFRDAGFLCRQMRKAGSGFALALISTKMRAVFMYLSYRRQIEEVARNNNIDKMYHLELLCPRVMQVYWIIRNKLFKGEE